MTILRRSLIGGSAATLVAAGAAKAQLIGRDGSISAGSIGYAVTVRLDGGPAYTYNPDTPGPNQTATDEGSFVSDFAGFTQRSIHCERTDTALRVYFRKDISPNPNRIEIILEMGHFTTDGSAANLGPFMLQILRAGVPQPIPIITTNGPSTTTSAHFASMGWWTRWRWNPTPRSIVRTGSQLLPSSLNLVPNFSATQATKYNAKDCGSGGANIITAYSSAYAPGQGNNRNPVGVNENCSIATAMGGVGGRPELGIVTEWQANWIVNGNSNARTAMMVLAEVDGGIPWCMRDSSTGWAPVNFNSNPLIGWYPGKMQVSNLPYTIVDAPIVPVPSGGGVGNWSPELNHTPSLSYVPYIATGDPFYLENLQFKMAYLIGANWYHRQVGWPVNTCDYGNSPTALVGFNQAFQLGRFATRGMAWAIRDVAQCYLATPASVPSWLLPKSYFKAISDLNQQQLDDWSVNYPTNHPSFPQYANLVAQGTLVSTEIEYGFYMQYLMIALGFAVNQAGLTNWMPQYKFAGKMPLAWTEGTASGWDKRWPTPYGQILQAVSTDYDSNPAAITSLADAWSFLKNNALLYQTNNNGWSVGDQTNGMRSIFPTWQPSTSYHCNSWVVEVRSGVPVLPSAGDVVALTISGSFAGSPVTVSHTVTAAEVAAMPSAVINSQPGSSTPVVDSLISAINANAGLSAAGITASITNTNTGAGSYHSERYSGRFYIAFNSDGSSVRGGPVIGPITVTGMLTTSTNNSLYIQPNGDGVNNGAAGANLFGRALSYQCGKSGVSAGSGGPTGHGLQTLVTDNTTNWCFAPEYKTIPVVVPGGPSGASPTFGWGGVYGYWSVSHPYVYWTAAGLACMQTAGIAGASTGRANMLAALDAYYTANPGTTNQFNFSIAP